MDERKRDIDGTGKLVGLAITADDPKLQAFMKELFAVAEKHRPEMIEMKGGAAV